jgi:hypothetical protein
MRRTVQGFVSAGQHCLADARLQHVGGDTDRRPSAAAVRQSDRSVAGGVGACLGAHHRRRIGENRQAVTGASTFCHYRRKQALGTSPRRVHTRSAVAGGDISRGGQGMKMTLRKMRRRRPQRLLIESVDLSLYIAHAEIDGQRYLLTEDDGRPVRRPNLLAMKEVLACPRGCELLLIQRSAYDEMVGQRHERGDNCLELRLGPGYESLPRWQH